MSGIQRRLVGGCTIFKLTDSYGQKGMSVEQLEHQQFHLGDSR